MMDASASAPSLLSNVDLSSEFYTDADTPSSSLLHATSGPLQPTAGGASAPTAASSTAPAAGEETSRTSRLCAFLSIEYYRPYFDVDTAIVLGRIKAGASPWKSEDLFASTQDAQPDLYGPFWIATTLIFFIAGESNLNAYLASASGKWEPNFTLLSLAATVVYVYVFLVPAAVWAAAKYSGVSASLVKLIALFGYALAYFVLASLLCIIPASWLQWVVVLAAGVASGAVLFRNLRATLLTGASTTLDVEAQTDAAAKRAMTAVLLGAMALHLTFALLLKLFFFQGAELVGNMSSTQEPST